MSNKLKKKPNIGDLAKAAVALAFPFGLCLVYCLIRGQSLFGLYLPASGNNDCLFYYKLVDGMVKYGMPRGYFGFNESRAMVGSLAAWNPVIFLPWVAWGKIFGWHYSSVWISNLTFFSLSLCAFSLMVKPKWKELLAFLVLLGLFPSLPIHLLNALPETMMASVLILYYAFAYRLIRQNKVTSGLVGMYVLSAFLTLIRPYMVLLFLLPAALGHKKKDVKIPLITGALMLLSLAGNVVLGHFFTSAYFEPLYDLSIIKCLLKGQIREALSQTKYCFTAVLSQVGDYLASAFRYGLTAGCQYVVALFGMIAALIIGVREKEKGTKKICLLHAATVLLLFLAILLFLRKANEGGRHVWVFAIAGILLLSFGEWNVQRIILSSILALCLVLFIVRGAMVPTDYDVPFADEGLKEEVSYWEEVFLEKQIAVSEEISYDNTVVWVLTDVKNPEDGKEAVSEVTAFGELFALPRGFGLSCCVREYVISHMDELKCGYLATTNGGEIDGMCAERGFTEIGRSRKLVIYKNK